MSQYLYELTQCSLYHNSACPSFHSSVTLIDIPSAQPNGIFFHSSSKTSVRYSSTFPYLTQVGYSSTISLNQLGYS